MTFRTLEELMERRRKILRDVKRYEEEQGGKSALVTAGIHTEEDEKFYLELAREALRDVEQEIAERTGQVPDGLAGCVKYTPVLVCRRV
jgi:2-iminoacetate synthase ThiH